MDFLKVIRRGLSLMACMLLGCGVGDRRGLIALSDKVGFTQTELRVNNTDLTLVDVYLPLDSNGSPTRQRPGLVHVQGGLVDVERYRWFATAMAENGYVVGLPRTPNNLAIFSGETQNALLQAMKKPQNNSPFFETVNPGFIAVSGHSLGGVMAGKAALSLPFQALMIHASFIDPADNGQLFKLGTTKTLFLAGRDDCQARLDTVKDSFQLLSSPAALVALSGVSHFQFTNESSADSRNGCAPKATLESAHRDIATASLQFLEAARLGRPLSGAFAGLESAEVDVR
jgi:hypothetical protein